MVAVFVGSAADLSLFLRFSFRISCHLYLVSSPLSSSLLRHCAVVRASVSSANDSNPSTLSTSDSALGLLSAALAFLLEGCKINP